jgi:hypothetical protein
VGTVFFQHYIRHPDPQAFSGLLTLLPVPEEPLKLLNPNSTLRLRRLDLPGGALYILLNAGGPVEASLRIAPGIRLVHLTQAGEEALAWQADTLELTVPGQDAVVLRMLPGA